MLNELPMASGRLSAGQGARSQKQSKKDERKVIDEIPGIEHTSGDIGEMVIDSQILKNRSQSSRDEHQNLIQKVQGKDNSQAENEGHDLVLRQAGY